ncbi:MAG: glucosaminidase domain-containing protein, partial [Armatimonadia bacterium]
FRAYEEVAPVQVMGAKLDQWLYNTQVTWSGVTRTPRLAGYGDLLIEQAYAYDVPIWLALGQCWRESQWGTTGLSIDHNCLWGVKDTSGKWGALRGTVAGFADYVSVPECVRAYYRLMDSPAYRGYIDAEDWARLLNKYDPQVSDGGAQHLRIVMIVKAWCEGHGIR